MATRRGSLSASDVTEAAIARMQAVNPALNAVVESLADNDVGEMCNLQSYISPIRYAPPVFVSAKSKTG